MKHLSLSEQLLLLSGIPLLALLAFAGLLAEHTFQTWRNVEQTVALERLIDAVEEYTKAIPAEAILSLGAQDTGSAAMKLQIPAARARADAAVAGLARQAAAAGLTDTMAVANLDAALAIDLRGNRARVDAGVQTLPAILGSMRPATMEAIELVGRLAVLSTDAGVSRLMLAYNAALSMNDALLVERNVRPIAGVDGRLESGQAAGEAEGVAQQSLLMTQLERLAAPAVLPLWHQFLHDPSARQIEDMRRNVLGVGGRLDASSVTRWSSAMDQRLGLMAPVLAASSASLRQAVVDLQAAAGTALAGYSALVGTSFALVLALVWRTRLQLARRIRRLSGTMLRLASGDLQTMIPPAGPSDELGEMANTLASFKLSLIERDRLATAQAAAAAALLDEKERLRVTLHAIGDGVIVTGSDRRVTMMNAAAAALTGWAEADALGLSVDTVLKLAGSAEAAPHDAASQGGDSTLLRADGASVAIDTSTAPILGQDGGPIGSIMVLHDVTESRLLLDRIRQLAHFDTLTGLPNRALFHERLAQAVLVAQRTGRPCGLLFLDMDRFKHVNDTLGHAVGDLLLGEVGRRLAMTIRESDTVARLGGDEFVVILGDLTEAAAAAVVAHKILESVALIDRIAGHEINVSFSIGIAIYPHDARDVEELLMRADAAMYQAKDAGRNAVVFFDPDMDAATQRRHQLRLQLAKALPLQQFILLYQPKIDLQSGRLTGAEALIRWLPESGEMVSPVDFIPVAEETGLILPIGEWVVNQACRQLQAWAEQGLPVLPVSVNVSMRSLRQAGFVATLREAFDRTGVPPPILEIEITESAAMADLEHTLKILGEIRSLGVRVSIDDFGTGFSSLSHLRRLPVDTIKIDRSFVSNMVEVEEDAALVRAIIGIATTMGKHVVAEGVETEAQRARLLQFGCREAQGFLFSEPVEPDLLARMLVRESDDVPA